MNKLAGKIGFFNGIREKIFLWFLIFSLFPLTLSIYKGYTNSREALKQKIFQQLSTIAEYQEYNLLKFMEERENNLKSFVVSNRYLFSSIKALEDKSQKKKKNDIL